MASDQHALNMNDPTTRLALMALDAYDQAVAARASRQETLTRLKEEVRLLDEGWIKDEYRDSIEHTRTLLKSHEKSIDQTSIEVATARTTLLVALAAMRRER